MSTGRWLILLGAILMAAGLVLLLGEKFSLRIGRLPGDIVWRGKNSVFYFPLATCILLSLAASVLLWLWKRR